MNNSFAERLHMKNRRHDIRVICVARFSLLWCVQPILLSLVTSLYIWLLEGFIILGAFSDVTVHSPLRTQKVTVSCIHF